MWKWLFGLMGVMRGGLRLGVIGFLVGWYIDWQYSRARAANEERWRAFFREYRHFGWYSSGQGAGNASGAGQRGSYAGASGAAADTSLSEAYKLLGVRDTASDEDVRAAYRRMALRYHPDRYAAQGEQAREDAERVFQQITQAKDLIFRVRGMK